MVCMGVVVCVCLLVRYVSRVCAKGSRCCVRHFGPSGVVTGGSNVGSGVCVLGWAVDLGRSWAKYWAGQCVCSAVAVPDDILKIKLEIEAELHGEDQSWGRGESNLSAQSQSRYSDQDNRDWRGRSAQLPPPVEERPWESLGRIEGLAGRLTDSACMTLIAESQRPT
ncbi:hypothetical protein Nepgr_015618 [Nepenthes gracilis]|uniref:Uncharacterized protein n=1 Tax=Nepenthes gracilis TaxID=150966 RepID=A0AAD3SMF2_NEPGR|nr:hypothetical protein Nepgr_015618 [Nepenthes gracilis]